MNTITNPSVASGSGPGRFKVRSLVVASLLAVLAGCSLTPDYQQPVAPVPSTIGEARQGAPVADIAISLQGWRDVFIDPQLQGLIETALEHNRDLREAVLNVEAARSQYRIQRSTLLPTVGAYGEGGRQRTPGDLSPTGSTTTSGQYAAGVMASYELDFFGRLRGLSTEALESYLATEEARRSAHISLVSEVASAYLSWVVDSQLLELAQNTQATRERTVDLVERQYQVGVATQLDVSQAKGALHDARSRTAEFDRLVQQDINALQFLTGSSETLQLTAAPKDLGSVVKLADIPSALPSNVLLNRPDILAAEHTIRAANGSIGAARAAFFPRIVLTGSAGTASADLSNLFSSGTGAWSFFPRLDLPIFDFGNRQANLDLAEVRRDIRINQYERAIQTGFREVADALVARSRYVDQLEAQEDLVEEAERTHTLSSYRYETGIDSFLQVLDAQRTLFNAQQSLLATRAEQQLNLVQLYRSLGGGWEEGELLPAS
ncbi:MAG: efflux transporter outer membrane subunit [Alcaligenaceae bacterium]|nr:efflux transporter outer membrane subunit [Alcaligenaceae bacterium]